eukprot:2529887-Pyramimonas_sp.AAC.1
MVTCCNTTPGKCYDFFIASKPMLHAIRNVSTDTNADMFPRRPGSEDDSVCEAARGPPHRPRPAGARL